MRDRTLTLAIEQTGEQNIWDWGRLPAQYDFLTSPYTFTLFSGGFGCGKTSALCAKVILLLTCIPNNLGFLGRQDGKSLRASTLQTLDEMLPPSMLAKRNDQQGLLQLKPEYGGSKLVYGDLQDLNDLKNLPLGFFALDQAEETSRDVWMYLVGRLRRRTPALNADESIQYYVRGHCKDGNRHVAIKTDTSCRTCGALLTPFDESFDPVSKIRSWDLITYRTYGFAACNPEGPSHWLFKLFNGLTGPNGVSVGLPGYHAYESSIYHARDAGFVNAQYVTDLEALYTASGHMASRYLLGHWVEAQGLVYPLWSRLQSVIPQTDVRFDHTPVLPPDFHLFEYIDHGMSAPTAVGWVLIEPCSCGCDRDNVWIIDEHYQSGRAVSYTASQIKEHRARLNRDIITTYLDSQAFSRTLMSTRREQEAGVMRDDLFSVADEYMDNGIGVVPTQKDWETGFNRISELLRPDPAHQHPLTGELNAPHLYIFEQCRHFIEEIEQYKWKKVRGTNDFREEPQDANDHHMDGFNNFLTSRPGTRRSPIPVTEKEAWVAELDREFDGGLSHMGL